MSNVHPQEVMSIVSKRFSISIYEMRKDARFNMRHQEKWARRASIYLMRRHTPATDAQIAEALEMPAASKMASSGLLGLVVNTAVAEAMAMLKIDPQFSARIEKCERDIDEIHESRVMRPDYAA